MRHGRPLRGPVRVGSYHRRPLHQQVDNSHAKVAEGRESSNRHAVRSIASLVSSRDAAVLDGHGASIPSSEFLRRLHEDDNDPYFTAIRWAVVLGDNGRLVAQIQGVPGPAAVLNGKPALKR